MHPKIWLSVDNHTCREGGSEIENELCHTCIAAAALTRHATGVLIFCLSQAHHMLGQYMQFHAVFCVTSNSGAEALHSLAWQYHLVVNGLGPSLLPATEI